MACCTPESRLGSPIAIGGAPAEHWYRHRLYLPARHQPSSRNRLVTVPSRPWTAATFFGGYYRLERAALRAVPGGSMFRGADAVVVPTNRAWHPPVLGRNAGSYPDPTLLRLGIWLSVWGFIAQLKAGRSPGYSEYGFAYWGRGLCGPAQ